MDLAEAMEKSGLTEEEAYFVLRFAGRLGYERAIRRLSSPWKTLRQWVIWVGGWEHPELSQWDRGVPAWELTRVDHKGRRCLVDPTPVSLFGYRITFFGWGVQARIRWGGRRLYLTLSRTYRHGPIDKLYLSPNGTLQHPQARFLWRRAVAEQ
jgi:hypothetical protein